MASKRNKFDEAVENLMDESADEYGLGSEGKKILKSMKKSKDKEYASSLTSTIKKALSCEDEENQASNYEVIVAGMLERVKKDPNPNNVKTLMEMTGEAKQKIEIEGEISLTGFAKQLKDVVSDKEW